ncbi:DNA-3-methyladenine glycosylase family protein, partial [Angustibacter speluncae]
MEPGERLLRSRGTHDSAWSLGFLAAHAVPGLETWDGRTYRRVLTGPDGPVVATVRAAAVGVRVQGPAAVDDPVRRLLALDDDRGAADAALGDDPLLGPLVRARPGLRVPGSTDHFETLVRTVVGQQVSLAAAATVTGRVVREHGTPLHGTDPAGPTHAFPSPDALAGLDPATLPMPRSRGRAVVAVAAAVAADPAV